MKYKNIITLIILTISSIKSCYNQANRPSIAHKSINDFSRLNKTTIHSLETPSSYQELSSIIDYAHHNNLKISVAGTRHSQGGHAFSPHGIVISLKKLNKILKFSPKEKTITVQTGTTWNDIQKFLNPHGYAVKIMQVANLFTIGGSLSVNCNGIDPHYGPLIESIQSIKVMLANGSIVTSSRHENSELFSLAIGGYGLFGIIIEATIEIVKNELYKKELKHLSLFEYVQELNQLKNCADAGFHFAFLRLKPNSKKLFGKVACFNFKKIDNVQNIQNIKQRLKIIDQEKLISIRKIGTKLWAKSNFIKALHWIPLGLTYKKIVSRNNIMRPPVSHLYVETNGETNLLQEYFIPINNLPDFINSLKSITQQLKINLMHVAFRLIRKNTESYLSYTTTDCIGIVLFLNQKMNPADSEKTKLWTQRLINTATQLNGTYYLPMQLHATKEQLQKIYPQINSFFNLKKQYDPSELFINHFYTQYAY